MKKQFIRAALPLMAASLLALGAGSAQARVSIGIGVGGGYYAPAPYYYSPYAYYPPYYYNYGAYQDPYAAYYGNNPGYAPGYAPPPSAPPANAYNQNPGEECREYDHSVVIGGVRQPAHGTACRQPDGTWKLMD